MSKNNNINTNNCDFVSNKSWFNVLFSEIINNQIKIINLQEYKNLVNKINNLKLKQNLNPLNSREVLINLKEIKKIIFQNQFFHDFGIKQKMNGINKNLYVFIPELKIIKNQLLKKKINLLSSIYEMERSLCLLELTRNITNNRNRLNIQLRNNENPKFNPKLRKLLRNWVEAINQSNITLNKINYLAEHLNNKIEKNEFSRIWKNLKKNNFDLSLRFKKKHLKTEKCKFAIQERTPNENSDFLHQLEDKPIIPWETILNMIGINTLSFLNEHPLHKRAIIELLNLYLMPITEQFDDIFRLKREYYLMCISFVLLDFNIENINYLPEVEGTSGFTATTRINESSIYKLENFRFENYPSSSYMSSIYLFSFFIQKYLYNLNNDFVPDIENIYYHFTQKNEMRKSITKMKLAKNNKNTYIYSINLLQLLIGKCPTNINKYFFEINNFEIFIIEILKKLCQILIFYQDACYFVHRDLHTSNIMINFNIIDNNFDLTNFEVKLIDFTYSSIIIQNKNRIKTEFMNSSYNYFNDPIYSNPYLNKEWNTCDLRYFIITLLFAKLYNGNQQKLEENIFINKVLNSQNKTIKLKNIRSILLSIFQIDKNYLANYILFKYSYKNNNKKCIKIEELIYREILFKKKVFNQIFGDKCKIEYFNPRYIQNKLNLI